MLDLVGFAAVGAGVVAMGLAAWTSHRYPARTRVSERVALGGLGVFLAGVMLATCAPLAPEVAGPVVARPRGKGDQFGIVVATPAGNIQIVGEAGTRERCREGQRVVKAAWTTAYSCDGAVVGSGSWAIYVAVAAEALLATMALAWAARG